MPTPLLYIVRDLLRSGPENDRWHRSEQDFEIQAERPVIDVIQIQFDPVVKIPHLIAPANLPETSQSRFYTEPAALRRVLKFLDLVKRQRPRPDEAHIAH